MNEPKCKTCERPLSIGSRCLDCIQSEIDERQVQRLIRDGRKRRIRKMKLT